MKYNRYHSTTTLVSLYWSLFGSYHHLTMENLRYDSVSITPNFWRLLSWYVYLKFNKSKPENYGRNPFRANTITIAHFTADNIGVSHLLLVPAVLFFKNIALFAILPLCPNNKAKSLYKFQRKFLNRFSHE